MFYIYPLVFPRGQTYAFAAEKAVNHNPFKTNRDLFLIASPHVRESNTVLDSGFHDVDSTGIPGTPDFSHFRWILFSGFQSLVGFRIPSAACFPNSTILDSRSSDCLTCEDLLNIFPCFLAVTFVSHKTWQNNFRNLFEFILSWRGFTFTI